MGDMGDMGEGLSYRDRLPVQWRPLQVLPDGDDALRIDDANLRVLCAVSVLEEHAKASDEPTPQELELVRIHNKLDLLLELVSGLLHRDAPRPPVSALRLSWQGVSWTAHDQPEVGAIGLVQVFLHPIVSQPLSCPARVVSRAPAEVHAEFVGMSEGLQAALQRHVFLHHRREVAETRQPARAATKHHPPA